MLGFVGELKAAFSEFLRDRAPRLASSIAYATIFAIAPLLIILIAVLGFMISTRYGGSGNRVAEETLVGEIQKRAGIQAANAVRDMIQSQFNRPHESIIAQIIGWIAFIIAASGLFAALQDALNTIWNVDATKRGWKHMIRDRFAAFAMILIVGSLITVSFFVNGILMFIASHYSTEIPVVGSPRTLVIINSFLNVALLTAIFALMFKVLPDRDIRWQDVGIGAFVTAILFVIGEALLSLYINRAGIASAYGAAGSVLVALVWIYYSAMILLYGAEYTKVHARGATASAAGASAH